MEWTKAYKGFDKDMKCRGFQYPESGEVHITDNPVMCKQGVHACEEPIEVFKYYSPSDSVFREVEIGGAIKCSDESSKICGTDIRIGAKLDIVGIVKAQIEYVKAHCTNGNNTGNGTPSTAGDFGAATAGNYGAAAAGDCGAATAGNYGAAAAGDCGAATARGAVSVGKNGVGTVRGTHAKIKGGPGAFIGCAVEYECTADIKTWAFGVIDGKALKPDIWYTVKDGKFVEVE